MGALARESEQTRFSTNHEMAQPPGPMIHKEGLEQESSNISCGALGKRVGTNTRKNSHEKRLAQPATL